ncbi:hypothetical protein SAMN04515617_11856 [Collimonas sp. OK242]|jgi:hypothetical protein|uniref:hypothetical protein n=1 Tax=Collimonas sp. OK242 TaxID=1798195 RepID=UPI000898AA9E|nr:hypothetical protein [Collimonas sp. OK242]SDY64701.1 hypothetical protein SAMN04515617_11856 [Collimonas sp. OK242]
MLSMLRGGPGPYAKFAFYPLIGSNRDLGPWSEKKQQDVEQKIRFQNWGGENMLFRDKEKSYFPPPEVW